MKKTKERKPKATKDKRKNSSAGLTDKQKPKAGIREDYTMDEAAKAQKNLAPNEEL